MIEKHRKKRAEQIISNYKKGYCRICGTYTELTCDHVPPQAAGNKGRSTITIKDSTLLRQNGIKFRTICGPCNSLLGSNYDIEFKNIYDFFNTFRKNGMILPGRYVKIKCNPTNVMRSICGHLLSIWFSDDIEDEINKPQKYLNLKKLQKFVLGEVEILFDYEFYYWYYPYDITYINQYWAMIPDGKEMNERIFGTTYKLYPIAFWMVDTNNSTLAPRLPKLPRVNNEIELKVDIRNPLIQSFPEKPKLNGATILSYDAAIKIKNKRT